MSRRLRSENEAAQKVKIEAEEEDDKLKQIKEKIFAPIVWGRVGTCFRVQDLKENYFEAALALLKEYYITNEVRLRNVEMHKDPVSCKSYMEYLFFLMKDTTSLIALDENANDRIAAVVVLNVIHKNDYGSIFNRVVMTEGEAQKKITEFNTALNRKNDIFEQFSCDSFLRIFIVCVHPDYRHKGEAIGYKMMQISLDVARSLRIPIIVGTFSCNRTQTLARKIGMEILQEISYVSWLDSMGHMIFDDPGAGNYTCALMAGRVPPAPSREDKKKVEEEGALEATKPTSTKSKKLTRQDKRDIIARKNL